MNHRLITALLTVVSVAALAGCGSSSSGTAPGTGAVPGAAGSNLSAPPTAGTGSAVEPIDVCKVIDAASAAKLSGQPYTTATENPPVDAVSQCAYNNDDSTALGVNVTVWEGDNTQNTYDVASNGAHTDVSGLGDKALWDNDNTLYVLMKGTILIQVNGLDDKDKAIAMAGPVIAALQ